MTKLRASGEFQTGKPVPRKIKMRRPLPRKSTRGEQILRGLRAAVLISLSSASFYLAYLARKKDRALSSYRRAQQKLARFEEGGAPSLATGRI
jgi:hypothetical protein